MFSEAAQPAARRPGRDHGLIQREPLDRRAAPGLFVEGMARFDREGRTRAVSERVCRVLMVRGDSSRRAVKGKARFGDAGSAGAGGICHQ